MLGLGNILTKGGALLGFPNKYSFSFDGSNDYLDAGTSLGNTLGDNYSGDLSVSMWFKASATNVEEGLFTIGNFNGAYGEIDIAYSANKIYFSLNANGWNGYINNTSTDWQHIAVAYKAGSESDTKVYINGSHVSFVATSGTFPSSANMDFNGLKNIIGAYYDTSYTFTGLIDEVAIWDTALDASTIAKLGSKPVDLTKYSASNLKLWLRAGDKVLPEEDTSIARSDFYTSFSTNDFVDCGADTSLDFGTGSFSIVSWIKPTLGTGDTLKGIAFKRHMSGSAQGFDFHVDDGADRLRVNISDGTGTEINGTTNSVISDIWQHAVVTIDRVNDLGKLYLNGVQNASVDISARTGTFTTTDSLKIGSKDASNQNFEGDISNVALYQTVLDAQTIKQFAKSRYTPMRDTRFSVVDFDGINDFIQLPAPFSHTNHSISVWANHSGINEVIFSAQKNGSEGIRLFIDDGNRLIYRVDTNDALVATAYANQWVHYVCTYDGSTMRVYANGVEVKTNSVSVTVDTSTNARIGATSFENGSYFEGSISSVALYNVTKDADFVYAQYQKGITHNPSADTGLVGLYRMGDDISKAYPTIADSSSNSNDGTITNGASDDIVQQMVAGYDMGAFESSSEELGGEKVDNNTSSAYGGGSESNIANVTNGVAITYAGTGTGLNATFSDASLLNTDIVASENKLHKLTFNAYYQGGSAGSKIRIYDQAVNHVTPSLTTTSASYSLYFRGRHASMIFQQVDMGSDNVVYITDMSFKEVLQSADLSDTYPAIIDVNEPVLGAELVTSNTTSNWTAMGSGTSKANITNGVTLTAGTDARNHYYAVSGTTNDKIYKFNVDAFIDDASDTGAKINVYDGSGSNLLDALTTTTQNFTFYFIDNGSGFIQFDGFDNGTTVNIQNMSIKEIQGNVGTMTNQDSADLVYSSVLPDQSFLATGVNSAYNFLDFDGTDAKVTLSSQQSLTGDFTISGWLKVSTAFRIFISDSTSDSIANYILMDNNLDLYLDFQGLSAITFTNSNLPSNQWFHFAITRNAKIFKCYVNSTLTDTEDKSSAGAYDQTWTYNQLGTYSAGQYWYDGNMSNFAIHNKELISTEISAIYNAGRNSNLLDSYSDNLKGYYAFGALDAVTGLADTDSTIYDRSGNSVHGTTSGTATGDLKSPPNAEPNGYAKGDTNRSTTKP